MWKGKWEFDHVVFGSQRRQGNHQRPFNATVQPEQRWRLWGPTGAGKTTMVNLLMRFYDVNSGAIRVDGVNIQGYEPEDLRSLFGMVLQGYMAIRRKHSGQYRVRKN